MPYYRHRWFWGLTSIVVFGALWAVPVIAMWGEPLSEWILVWPAHLIMLTIWSWWWFMVVRHISKEVVVDEDGLWIDGERQLAGPEIIAVGVVEHATYDSRLRRVDDAGRRAGFLAAHLGASAWSQSAWVRLLDVDGVGRVAVTRERDLGRGSGWPGILLVVDRPAGVGGRDLRDLREGWIIGAYDGEGLLEALVRIAPDAELLADADPEDVRGRL